MIQIEKTLVLMVVMTTLFVAGCSQQQKAATSSEAIQQASSLKTPQEQVNYLIGQANAFVSSKKYDEAVSVANHILSNVDQTSQEAKNIITKAQAELQALAEQKLGEVKGEANKALDNVQKSIGNLGK